MGTKWVNASEREVASVLRRSDLGLAALAGAGATLVAVGLLLPIDAGRHYTSSVVRTQDRSPVSLYGPRPLTIQPCTEDGVVTIRTPDCLTVTGSKPCDLTLYDGSCGHPDVNDLHDGYWWPASTDDAGTIAPLQLEKP